MLKIIYVSLVLVLLGCSGTRLVISDKSLDTRSQDELSKVIDPSRLYELVSVYSLIENKELDNFKKRYLKFYSNGKARTFYSWNPTDAGSLNPEYSEKGYYKISNGKLQINMYFNHPQGGGYVKKFLYKVENKYIYILLKMVMLKNIV